MKKRILAGMMMGIMVLASAMSVSAAPSTEDFAEVVVPESSTQGDYKAGDYVILDEKEEFKEFESKEVMTQEAQAVVEAVIESVYAKEVEKAIEEAIAKDASIANSEDKKAAVVEQFKKEKVEQIVKSYEAAAVIIKEVESGKEIGTVEGVKINDKVDKDLKDKKMVKTFFDLHATGDKKDICHSADEKHIITISVPGMTKHWKNITILHYSTIRCVWETIVPKVDYDKKTLTFEIQDLSPIAIYADIEGEGADTDKEFAKTGSVSSTWMIWSAMALIVLGTGAIVSQKKRG